MLFQTGPRALLGPTARVPGGSEPPGTASSDASELAVPGVTPPFSSPECRGVPNPLALGTRKWGVTPGTASSDASELAVPGGTEPPGTAAQNRADLLFVLGGMCNEAPSQDYYVLLSVVWCAHVFCLPVKPIHASPRSQLSSSCFFS